VLWTEQRNVPIRDVDGTWLAIEGVARDITERRSAEEEVRAGRERLKALSRQLLEAQEAERRHIARELHDEVGQALTILKMNLQALQRSPGTPASAQLQEESIGLVERALQQVRTLSLDLRPSMLDDLGLVAALRWYTDRQAQRGGLAVEFDADPLDSRLPAQLETACFRVAQEALVNVLRHAQAGRVKVELRLRDSELHLLVGDDGVGFDVRAAQERAARGASLGLLGMQERAQLAGGRIDIASAPAAGTHIRAVFPLPPVAAPMESRPKRKLR
jgi:signal transduction histidine kinase